MARTKIEDAREVQYGLDHGEDGVHHVGAKFIDVSSRRAEDGWLVARCPECNRECSVVVRELPPWSRASSPDPDCRCRSWFARTGEHADACPLGASYAVTS